MPNITLQKKQKNYLKCFFLFTYTFAFCLLTFNFYCYALSLDKLKANVLSGDYKQAIAEGEKLIAGASASEELEELYYLLGLSYLKDGNYLRASDIFEIILNEFRSGKFKEEAMLGLGDTYFLRQNFPEAQRHYEELLQKYPNSKFKAQAYFRLSQLGFKKGDTELGSQYLEKLKSEFPLNSEIALNDAGSCDLPVFSADGPYYTVQVGAFSSRENAQNLTQKLIQKNYPAYIEETFSQGKASYRVRVGKLHKRAEALSLEEKLSQEGFPTKVCP